MWAAERLTGVGAVGLSVPATPPPFPSTVERVVIALALCVLCARVVFVRTDREPPAWLRRGLQLSTLVAVLVFAFALWLRFGQ